MLRSFVACVLAAGLAFYPAVGQSPSSPDRSVPGGASGNVQRVRGSHSVARGGATQGGQDPSAADFARDGRAGELGSQPSKKGERARWRSPGGGVARASSAGTGDANTAAGADGRMLDVPVRERPPGAHVTQTPATLPNEAGQVWREYDISDYTLRVTNTARPEQAIVDWILRETGYEAWHSEPLGILSAGARKLIVYHTPEMQAIVADVVDRFVNREAETHAFSLRVVSVGNPNWRARAQAVMQPIEVQTQGIQAWLMQREDAALLLAELRKRTDFREHSAPHLLVANGQSAVVTQTRPRTYIQHVVPKPEVWPGYEIQQAKFDEGFALELSPLLSLDGRMIDAVIHCQIDQLERLVPVMFDVPTAVSPRQRTKIEVPQVTHCRLHERFRWPTNQVLVVGLGVVANPVARESSRILPPLPLVTGPERADLLVFVESKGRLDRQTVSAAR